MAEVKDAEEGMASLKLGGEKKEEKLNINDPKWAVDPSKYKPHQTLTWGTDTLDGDGWVASHNQIRSELGALAKAAEALAGRENVKVKHMEIFLKFWTYELAVIQRHHQLEEKLWYPTYQVRIKFPQDTGHKELEALLVPIKKALDDLKKEFQSKAAHPDTTEVAGFASLKPIAISLRKLNDMLLEHFAEEEKMIPLVRAFFTKDEVGKMAQNQAATVPIPDPHHTGGFFGTMVVIGGEPKVREFMTMAGIPSFVFGLKFKGLIMAYHNELWIPLQEVIQDKEIPRLDGSGCVIL
eukprot:gb/GEZN01014592.1/.p1 GENE.gb/GEZN01014592.1/~~gb/GEZN01014592.1/.p1  ORF type:complete len:303 (+),score=61.09 gb/GEZN01014592.1/:25-909(+)